MTVGEATPRPQPGSARRVLGFTAVIVAVALGTLAIGAWQTLVACACSSPGPAPSYPASPVEGVVVAVDSSGLGNVAGFSIRIAGGSTVSFDLGALENASEFSPSHLTEHMASSEPIRVYFELGATRAVAYRLEDAPS